MNDWIFYIENDNREFYSLDIDNQIAWSKYIIDAKAFDTEAEAYLVIKQHGLHFCTVGARSGPPQYFLYKQPGLPPKEQRLRYYDHTRPTKDLLDEIYDFIDDNGLKP